ncbi:MAG: aspartate aminotransferase family protein [Deltaproteobacteria bacterium]|nr:aspartate aminotransferase family protein [Deltaproteobacteria bacterium]
MSGLPKTSQRRADLLARLKLISENDLRIDDPRAMVYVFRENAAASTLGEEVLRQFCWNNALDARAFPSALVLEREVVAIAAGHLSGDAQVCGNFTSGGTESIILAVKAARDRARVRGVSAPEMILPQSAHPAFHKAAQLLGLRVISVPVDGQQLTADVPAIAAAINAQTALIVGSAPSYAHGVLDPIDALGELAIAHDLPLHVDACIGGFVLPLFEALGQTIAPFDFRVPGVSSISIDFHKYAGTPLGASVVLYREPALRRHQIFSFSGWPGYALVNPTLQSSRSAGPLAATWAMLHSLGRPGYLAIAQRLLDGQQTLLRGLARIDGVRVLGNPVITLCAITSEIVNVFALAEQMRKRGWRMHPQFPCGDAPASIHLNVLPVNSAAIPIFLDDLERCVSTLAAAGEPPVSGAFASLAETLTAVAPDQLADGPLERIIDELIASGEIGDGEMTALNNLLSALPAELRDRLLTIYSDRISR